MWKTILREPLVHFLVLGAVLFALDAARGDKHAPPAPAADAPVERTIVVDAELARRKSPAELERWIDEEILFREALARGLERDDPMIHERIASRMSYVLAQSAVVPEPTEDQLRAWFDANRDHYATPQRIDFTHVFIANGDEARASSLMAQLGSGASPDTLGDPFSGGRKYRGRKLADLAEAFGAEFADGLAAQPAGKWVRRKSRHGLHLVRIDRVEAARDADFATAKLEVRREWVEEQRQAAAIEALRRLRASWKVERR